MVKKQKIPTLRCTTLCWSACLVNNKIIRDSAGLLVHASILKVLQRESPSSADEMRKTMKSALRRSTKCRNRRKMLVVGRRNAGIAGKRSLSVDETLDLPKIIRHPWMKMKKRQKMPVIHG